MNTKWNIDTMHSEIEFKVKHLMISTVTGKFNSFTAEAETEGDDFSQAKIGFSAEVNSLTTGTEYRDTHLKSDDFFNAEKFPHLNFVSLSVEISPVGHVNISGDLTIRDVTKTIQLTGDFNGIITDPYGKQKAGFELSGKINRKDFNLNWSATTEAGGVVVSDEVKLVCNVQMVKIAD